MKNTIYLKMTKNWHPQIHEVEALDIDPIKVEFKYLGDKKIKKVNKSCSCYGTKLNNGILTVHLENELVKNKVNTKLYREGKRDYIRNAVVTIVYEDNTTEELKVTATIKEALPYEEEG